MNTAELIEKSRWAMEFSWEQIQLLAEHARVVTMEKDDLLFREGYDEAAMYVVISGCVEIIKTDSTRHGKVLARHGPGKTIGEMSLIDGERRSADAIASEPTVLVEFSKDAITALGEKAPKLALKLLWKIAATISQRLRKTTGDLVEHLGKLD